MSNEVEDTDFTVDEVREITGMSRSVVYERFVVRFGKVDQAQVDAWTQERESAKNVSRLRDAAKDEKDKERLQRAHEKMMKVAARENMFSEPWVKMFLRFDDKYRVKPTPHNLATILEHDDAWKGVIAKNMSTGDVMLMAEPPMPDGSGFEESTYPRGMTDVDLTRMRQWLNSSRYELDMRADLILSTVESVAQKNAFHPIADYLNGLTWDGVPRIATWLARYLGVPMDLYSARVASWFLMSACARIRYPGAQADHVLVLEGPQGIGKSSACRILAKDPEWYLSGVRDLANKETAMQLRGKWVVEFPELSAMKRSEVESIKEFFTTHTDKYVPKYKNIEVKSARECVFVATVNHAQYLSDASGNRRFWPVEVRKVDLAGLAADVDMLWAEADECVRAYETCQDDACRAGTRCEMHRWWPTLEEQEMWFSAPQAKRLVEDAWKPSVIKYMLECFTKGFRPTTAEVIAGALNICPGDITEGIQVRMVRLLKGMGYRQAFRGVKETHERVSVWGMETWQFVDANEDAGAPTQVEKIPVDSVV